MIKKKCNIILLMLLCFLFFSCRFEINSSSNVTCFTKDWLHITYNYEYRISINKKQKDVILSVFLENLIQQRIDLYIFKYCNERFYSDLNKTKEIEKLENELISYLKVIPEYKEFNLKEFKINLLN